jgi:uncharacterized membrane protein YcgQ (UPF0703/DUF1980 family)
VAKRQRILLWFVLALLVLNGLNVFVAGSYAPYRWIASVQLVLMVVVQLAALIAVLQLLSTNRCTDCGYIFVGNESATSPECGPSLVAGQL